MTQIPDFNWQKTVYSLFDSKYCAFMKQCFIVHPTFMLKAYLTVMTPFLSSDFRNKVNYVDLKGLFSQVDRNSINLPTEVFHYDQKETGTNWFKTPNPVNPHDQL